MFKAKYNFDGSLERYKARLVTKDYTQKTGIDFTKTFSLVVKMVSVRSVLALTVAKWWNLFQMDVNNVFLQGDLDDEVYMDIPQGYVDTKFEHGSSGRKVCRLFKSLYGLKQASRQWNLKLTDSALVPWLFPKSI